MAEAVRYRWKMGAESRALSLLTFIFLAWGLATVYSASAIVEMEAGQSPAHLLLRQAIGMVVGLIVFAIAAKTDAEFGRSGRGR
jgi:Bacterial cell division membrane protein